jgi:dUTP pyrophosphatase
MNLKFVRLSDLAILPSKSRDSDAGYDLYATENYVLKPLERKLFKTNIALAIPFGYEGQIRDRSGKALKEGLHVLGGTIDASYRGDVGIILYNTNGSNSITITKGDKIAQIVISECANFELEEVKSLDETDRGEKGYGSSGK